MTAVLRRRSARLAVACGISAAAFGLKYFFVTEFHLPGAFLVFFPAVFLSTWWGDREGGLVALCLTSIGAGWYIEVGDLGGSLELRSVIALGLFAGVGLILVHLTARLQESLVARDYLFSAAAHDLKTPLMSIMLQVQLMHGDLSADPHHRDVKTEKQLALIGRQTDQLMSIVNNLLDLGRIERRRLQLEPRSVDLAEVIRDVMEAFVPQLRHFGQQVIFNPEGTQTGEWDPLSLRRILQNLLGNAIKYGDKRPIEIALGGSAGEAWFTLRDHGPGMPTELRKRVFEPFRRAARARAFYSSHGLGLWIVRSLVEAHGGRMSIEAPVGGGSQIRVTLPRRLRGDHRGSLDLVASR